MVLETWTAHPARRRPRDVALVAAVVLLTAGGVLGTFQSALFATIATAILIASVAPFLFPTRYVLTDLGIEQHRAFRSRARPWGELRRLQVGSEAALVSPFARPSALDRYRGIIVMFDGVDRERRERIVHLLRERVGHEPG
jgi:hypothetical protein